MSGGGSMGSDDQPPRDLAGIRPEDRSGTAAERMDR